jgi:hypothetical protein
MDTVWELPFGERAELELRDEWGRLTIVAVEPGRSPRLELTRESADNVAVHVEKLGETVRVALDPRRSMNWFGGGWECRATVYVPTDVRAHVQTSAGSVSVRDLVGCELGIKANAGKIDLSDVHGVIHLAADAGSVNGRAVGGFFDVQTHAGSVRLEISDLQPGEHHIRASLGSVRVELARGLDVCVESHTSLGSVRNSYPSHPTAATKLVLSSDMGSVHVAESLLQAPMPAYAGSAGAAGSAGSGGSAGAAASAANAGSNPAAAAAASTVSASARSATSATTSAASAAAPGEDPELERILKMVESGSLTAHEADDLLRAMGRV